MGNKTVNEGVLLSFTISGTDIDTDDTLSYYVYNMPTGAVLNANTGLFTWTPNYVQAGVYNTVTFRVIDPYGLYDDEIITITVNNVPAPPTITTEPATGIDVNLTTLNGTVNPNELSTTAYFQWGISANYGATTTAQALGNGASILNVSQVITGLEHNSTYYFRIAATNIIGTSYGQSRSFTTGTNTNWAMVVGGETHSMGIKNDGSLWAWGDNSDGQLGLADTISRTTPTRVGALNTWVEVACGSGFTIARKNNHTLWGSGDNSEGQLGLGALTQTLSFMQIGTILIGQESQPAGSRIPWPLRRIRRSIPGAIMQEGNWALAITPIELRLKWLLPPRSVLLPPVMTILWQLWVMVRSTPGALIPAPS